MGIRINKYLSQAGFCSRREADALIEKGEVKINGELATLGSKVMSGDVVVASGKVVRFSEESNVVLAYNKPVGVECTSNKTIFNNIIDAVGFDRRVYPIGRLDKDSKGLILLTDDGDLTYHLLRTAENHCKEYYVKVDKAFDDEFIRRMGEGVPILGKITRKCKIWRIDKDTFGIELMQGLNRQIRRMCEYFGYKVLELKRVRIENVKLGNLLEGEYRIIKGEELEELRKRVIPDE